jgi:AcrR family transcriptional regulator
VQINNSTIGRALNHCPRLRSVSSDGAAQTTKVHGWSAGQNRNSAAMNQTRIGTRDRILDAGLDLLSTSGFAGVTIDVLANQVGMSKSGLFAHFKSKEDIDIALLERMVDVAHKHVVVPAMRAQEGLSRLTALVENWFGWSTKAGLVGGCRPRLGCSNLLMWRVRTCL